mgnify:CR=1 FL=1
MKFSVLMSVYNKENPDYLRLSLESILVDQSVIPTEVVLVEDGPLTDELYIVLEDFKSRYSFLKTISLKSNVGLGLALNEGLKHCRFDWVARMDSDDIAIKTRFEEQLKFIKSNPTIDIVGGGIDEFLDSIDEIVSHKSVPTQHDEIVKMAKRRNPLCHMTVMFKKERVEKAGGYLALPYVEDYYLWVRMIATGAKLSNIDKTLVYARVGNGMFNRRGNKEQITSWKVLNQYMMQQKLVSPLEVFINQIYIRLFVYMPASVKKVIYGKVLRK